MAQIPKFRLWGKQIMLLKDIDLEKKVIMKENENLNIEVCFDVKRVMQVSINLLKGFAKICK